MVWPHTRDRVAEPAPRGRLENRQERLEVRVIVRPAVSPGLEEEDCLWSEGRQAPDGGPHQVAERQCDGRLPAKHDSLSAIHLLELDVEIEAVPAGVDV